MILKQKRFPSVDSLFLLPFLPFLFCHICAHFYHLIHSFYLHRRRWLTSLFIRRYDMYGIREKSIIFYNTSIQLKKRCMSNPEQFTMIRWGFEWKIAFILKNCGTLNYKIKKKNMKLLSKVLNIQLSMVLIAYEGESATFISNLEIPSQLSFQTRTTTSCLSMVLLSLDLCSLHARK